MLSFLVGSRAFSPLPYGTPSESFLNASLMRGNLVRARQATLASITWLIDASDYFARHVRHRLCGSPGWKLFTCQYRKSVHSDEPEDSNFSEKSYRLIIGYYRFFQTLLLMKNIS